MYIVHQYEIPKVQSTASCPIMAHMEYVHLSSDRQILPDISKLPELRQKFEDKNCHSWYLTAPKCKPRRLKHMNKHRSK